MKRQRILQARIRCHELALRIAARDGDAKWVVRHQRAIDELTARVQAAQLRREHHA